MKKTSILAIVLFLAGCVGTSSPSHFYQLQMTDARVEPVSSRRLDVGVEEAFVPKYLDRPQIVTVEAGSSELNFTVGRNRCRVLFPVSWLTTCRSTCLNRSSNTKP